MRKRPGVVSRKMGEQYFLISEGEENIDFSRLISLSPVALDIWPGLPDSSIFSIDDMVDILLKEYDVDEKTARADLEELAEQLIKAGVIIEQ